MKLIPLIRNGSASNASDLFSDFFEGFDTGISSSWKPLMDVMENETCLEIHMEVPGVEDKDLEITASNGVLWIKGTKHDRRDEKAETHPHSERYYGEFKRGLKLPNWVDTENVDAKLKNGVLKIFMERLEKTKPKSISVTCE